MQCSRLQRKHIKERGLKSSSNVDVTSKEEAKVHSSRIKRGRSSRRAGILLHCFIVVALFSWFGMQNLTPGKSHFSPLINMKKTSFVSNFNDFIASWYAWLPFTSRDSLETNQLELKQRQKMEDDYVFIFYALLCVNLLAMLPSFFQRYIKTRNNTNAYQNSIQNGMEMAQPVKMVNASHSTKNTYNTSN
jgi:hypothetical protein